jgi:tetratricopeptide (TPR) repeat protein
MKQTITLAFAIFAFAFSGASQNSEKLSEMYFEKASIFFDQQNYKTCIRYCDSAIVANTENTEAYAFRGTSNFLLKDYEKAIEDFDLALILNEGYAEVYYYRGLCKLELGAKEQACNDWYEAYDLGFKRVIKIIEANCALEKGNDQKEGK